jgi:hypothetical protein
MGCFTSWPGLIRVFKTWRDLSIHGKNIPLVFTLKLPSRVKRTNPLDESGPGLCWPKQLQNIKTSAPSFNRKMAFRDVDGRECWETEQKK